MIRGLLRSITAAWGKGDAFWFRPVDARVYALFRMAFALVALVNVVELWPHRHALLSDGGLIGRPDLSGRPILSLPELSALPIDVAMVIAALSALWLASGVRARLAAALLFVWHFAYTAMAYPAMHGWDILLRILSFIVLISPLGPSWREWPGGRRAGAVARVSRHGLVLAQIQLAVLYWQTVWLKAPDPYWRNGEFFSHFMLSIYSRFPSPAWAGADLVSAGLTYLTLAFEAAIPLLLWRKDTRWAGIAAGVLLHGAITVTSHILLFSLAVLVPYIAFLDGWDLDRIGARLRKWREGDKLAS